MTQNIKPFIDQLKRTLSSKDQVGQQVRATLLKTRETVESKARDMYAQTRDLTRDRTRNSKIVNQYVVPLLQSEKTEQAIQTLGQKFAKLPIATKFDLGKQLEKYRNDLINLAQPNNKTEAQPNGKAAAQPKSESAFKKNAAKSADLTDENEFSDEPTFETAEKSPIKIKRSKGTNTESKN